MATIKEDYVSFEVAKLLKEKGFNWDCITYYVDFEPNDVKYSMLFENNTTWEERCYSAPTLQMTMKWLREVYKLHIEPHIQSYKNYNGNIYNLDGELLLGFTGESPEQACKTAIKYCLEHII